MTENEYKTFRDLSFFAAIAAPVVIAHHKLEPDVLKSVMGTLAEARKIIEAHCERTA